MKKKRVFPVLVGALALVLLGMVFIAVSDRESAAQTPKKLTIGVLACLTGWFSGFDTHNANETQLVAEYINEKGGINIKGEKYMIETVVEDVKSTLDGVTSAANKLVFDKQVKFIVGPQAYFHTAAAPVTTPNKVITVMGFCTNQPGELDKTTPYAFLGHNSNIGEALASLKYLKQNYPKVKKLVVVTPDDGAIPYLAPILKRLFAENGFEMVGEPIGYSNETMDYNPIAAKINAVKDADAIFHKNGISLSAGGMVKALRNMGNTKPYASSLPAPLSEIVAIAGKTASKDVFGCAVTPVDPANTPLMNEIGKRVLAKYGKDTTINFMSANGLWILKQAIEAAGSTDPVAVTAKWEAMDKVDTLFGPGRMCGDQIYGIKHHVVSYPQPMQRVKDGSVVSAGLIDPGIFK